MTRNTQSNPIIQITNVFMGFVSPLNSSALKSCFPTMFASIRSTFPSTNPSMKRTIGNSIPFPIPCFTSIFFTKKGSLAFSATRYSMICFNIKEFFVANRADVRDLFLGGVTSTFKRTINTSIWSRPKSFKTKSASFVNHKIIIT